MFLVKVSRAAFDVFNGFVISASITDKSMLAGLEPLYDVLSGNPAAINRWASSIYT